MNKIRHSIIICSLIIIPLILTACSSGGTHVLKDLFKSDKDIANESFEKIISALESQDKAALKNLFSKKAIAASDSFNENMDALFDYYNGKEFSYQDWGGPNTNYGINYEEDKRKWKNMQSTYDVETDKGIYRFAIKTFYKDSSDSDNIGIYSLYIIKAEESDMQYAYWGDGQWTPGIIIGSTGMCATDRAT